MHCILFPFSDVGQFFTFIKKYKTFIKKYNVLFCFHYSLWIIPTSGMGLSRTLCFDLWYGLGPSFMSQLLVWAWTELNLPLLQKGMGYPFCGLILYLNFPTSTISLSLSLKACICWPSSSSHYFSLLPLNLFSQVIFKKKLIFIIFIYVLYKIDVIILLIWF